MGKMIDGQWTTDEVVSATTNPKGEFIRAESVFRSAISAAGDTPHPPAKDRYHFFLAKG